MLTCKCFVYLYMHINVYRPYQHKCLRYMLNYEYLCLYVPTDITYKQGTYFTSKCWFLNISLN